MDLETIAN